MRRFRFAMPGGSSAGPTGCFASSRINQGSREDRIRGKRRPWENRTCPTSFPIWMNMKSLLATIAIVLATLSVANAGYRQGTYVHSYTKKDGTHVSAHYRSGGYVNVPVGETSIVSDYAGSIVTSSGVAPQSVRFIPESPVPRVKTAAELGAFANPYIDSNGRYVPGHWVTPRVAQPRIRQVIRVPAAPRKPLKLSRPHPLSVRILGSLPTSGKFRRDAYGTEFLGSPNRLGPSTSTVGRDFHGRIKRSESAKLAFMRMTGYAHGRPGYVVDHVVPLAKGGADDPSNMQWQTIQDAKAKDKWERR